MNLKRIKCMIAGHEWHYPEAKPGYMSGRLGGARKCMRCGCEWEGIRLPPTPPMPSVPRARVLSWGISIPEMQQVPPPPKPPVADRIKIDEARDVVLIDGHPFDGSALDWLTTPSQAGRWFRIIEAPEGGPIVITTQRDWPLSYEVAMLKPGSGG